MRRAILHVLDYFDLIGVNVLNRQIAGVKQKKDRIAQEEKFGF